MRLRRFLRLCAAGLLLAATAPAHAGWREELGTFRIGMVAENGSERTVPGLEALRGAYSLALGMPVEFFVARDYAALMDAHARGRIEYALYSATAYALAWRRCGCVEPVAAPRGIDGSTGFRAVVISRSAGLSDLEAESGLRIVAGPDGLVAAAALHAAPAVERLASAGEAEEAFLSGEAAGLVGWMPARRTGELPGGGTLGRLAALGLEAPSPGVIWSSDLVAYGPHAVRSDLAQEAKALLRRFLLALHARDPDLYERLETHRQGGFRAASHEDYAPVIDMLDRI